ncbi:NHL repeat-containing protein [Lacipirellula limnantheis]|uniref:NHL repeat protein n=1 Tax=Lacipirellula limnantheis TaxID=2528024 RepID=A0A517TV26_9BACT|nr:hypothetical protein [Lacipirellula limnantheis]QDT72230.1 hypothetical protein I41_14010 [Lacipirellula limnantheis]
MMHRWSLSTLFILITLLTTSRSGSVSAIGFDRDDFLIAGGDSDNIGVFDSDLTFKGYLDTSIDNPFQMAFDDFGRAVVVAQGQPEIRVYDHAGNRPSSLSFVHPNLGIPGNVTVGPDGNYFVATQTDHLYLQKFSPAGLNLGTIGSDRVDAAVSLPNGELWTGRAFGSVNVFDTASGAFKKSLPIGLVSNLSYSEATDTVFVGDVVMETIREFATDGTLLREFLAPELVNPEAIVRGPNNDVFATSAQIGVFRWKADGTFVGVTSMRNHLQFLGGMLWAGNAVPEPSHACMVYTIAICAFACRKAPREIR